MKQRFSLVIMAVIVTVLLVSPLWAKPEVVAITPCDDIQPTVLVRTTVPGPANPAVGNPNPVVVKAEAKAEGNKTLVLVVVPGTVKATKSYHAPKNRPYYAPRPNKVQRCATVTPAVIKDSFNTTTFATPPVSPATKTDPLTAEERQNRMMGWFIVLGLVVVAAAVTAIIGMMGANGIKQQQQQTQQGQTNQVATGLANQANFTPAPGRKVTINAVIHPNGGGVIRAESDDTAMVAAQTQQAVAQAQQPQRITVKCKGTGGRRGGKVKKDVIMDAESYQATVKALDKVLYARVPGGQQTQQGQQPPQNPAA